ncbi:Gustatory receptor 67b [Halyomorpha halys]|nr:Gustatory receptor 67b [Halyomorpha halys]
MASRPFTLAIVSNLIFRVSSLLGMFPFRVVRNELKIDKVMLLYSFVLSLIITIEYLYIGAKYIKVAFIKFNENSFNHIIRIIVLFVCNVILLPSFLCFYYQRNVFRKIVRSLDAIIHIFHQTGLKIEKRPVFMMNCFEIFFPLVCCNIFFLQGNTGGSISRAIGHTIVPLEMAIVCGQFNFFVDTVTNIFQSSTKFLTQMKPPVPFWKLRTLNKIVDATNQLIATSTEINKLYSLQLLINILVGYISAISHLYYIYLNGRSNYEQRYWLAVGDIVMLFYHIFLLQHLIQPAAQAHSKEFNTLLYQLMIEDMTNEFIHNEKLKLHIAMKREVVFSVCGFFNLDYTLLHSMIASAATYLVILIQFGDPAS